MRSKLFVVVGGAYGSEGKGAVAGRICSDAYRRGAQVVGVRVGGPNAGHTVIGNCPPDCESLLGHLTKDPAGHAVAKHPWRLRQVPVAAVTSRRATLVIAAGSEVDPDVLAQELRDLDAAGYGASERLLVDPSATMLTPAHIATEHHRGINKRLGSTAKGIGAARADRIWREAETWGEYAKKHGRPELEHVQSYDTANFLAGRLANPGSWVVIEGTQGYGLGLHTDAYPFVTSGDCRAVDFLAQAGVSPWQVDEGDLKVVVCMRPYPIRVAGNSGPLKDETSWDALGLPVEHTTVTNKVRRVGGWDPALSMAAYRANGGPRDGVVWVALTMMDSVEPELAGADWSGRWDPAHQPKSASVLMHSIGLDARHLAYVGTGPDTALINQRMYH